MEPPTFKEGLPTPVSLLKMVCLQAHLDESGYGQVDRHHHRHAKRSSSLFSLKMTVWVTLLTKDELSVIARPALRAIHSSHPLWSGLPIFSVIIIRGCVICPQKFFWRWGRLLQIFLDINPHICCPCVRFWVMVHDWCFSWVFSLFLILSHKLMIGLEFLFLNIPQVSCHLWWLLSKRTCLLWCFSKHVQCVARVRIASVIANLPLSSGLGGMGEGALTQQGGIGVYLKLAVWPFACLSLVLAFLRVVDMRPKTEGAAEPSECHRIQWCFLKDAGSMQRSQVGTCGITWLLYAQFSWVPAWFMGFLLVSERLSSSSLIFPLLFNQALDWPF